VFWKPGDIGIISPSLCFSCIGVNAIGDMGLGLNLSGSYARGAVTGDICIVDFGLGT